LLEREGDYGDMKELAVRQQAGIVTSSLEEVTERFISSLDVKRNSRYTYRRALRQFTEWISEKGITNPEREDILSYKRDLEARSYRH
jgi:site-specific recombinase XerD